VVCRYQPGQERTSYWSRPVNRTGSDPDSRVGVPAAGLAV
jgi:hypothetical protein